jgi:hypothetical protein
LLSGFRGTPLAGTRLGVMKEIMRGKMTTELRLDGRMRPSLRNRY